MEKHAADGKGVDHIMDWFPAILHIYGQALEM